MSQPALSESIANFERELGVSLLDRARTGAKVNAAGRELLPFVAEILDSIERLRAAADEQRRSARVLRIGTVNAATVPLLAPAVHEFTSRRTGFQVEIVNARQDDIERAMREGRLDLGLTNRLSGDDPIPNEFDARELLRGRPVVCFAADSLLRRFTEVPLHELVTQPMVAMRPGYVMHRYLLRLFGGHDRAPSIVCYADGAEMGKVLAAEHVGVTLLPEYSVAGDPLHRAGVIDFRRIDGDATELVLHALFPRTRYTASGVREFLQALATNTGRGDAAQPEPGTASNGSQTSSTICSSTASATG